MQRRRKAAPADPPAPLPVVIEEIEAQEPAAALPGHDDAAALLELAGGDPATLAALRALLQAGLN